MGQAFMPPQVIQLQQNKPNLLVEVTKHAKRLKKMNITSIQQLECYHVDSTKVQTQLGYLTCLIVVDIPF